MIFIMYVIIVHATMVSSTYNVRDRSQTHVEGGCIISDHRRGGLEKAKQNKAKQNKQNTHTHTHLHTQKQNKQKQNKKTKNLFFSVKHGFTGISMS